MLALSYTIQLPLNVPVSKKKKFWLNLNQYRNTHHQSLAKAKVNFHEIVAPRVAHLPRFDTINIVYIVYPGSEQLMDTSNVCSIQDKFFSDVLVAEGKIVDDNRKIVLSALYLYQEIDRINPRVEAVIIPGDETSLVQWLVNRIGYAAKEEPVQIMIVQDEIEEAIRDFVKKKLTVNSGQKITVDLRATRGDEGYTAMIDIVDETAPVQEPAPQASAPAAKPAPKTERPKAVTKAELPKAAPAKAEPEVVAAEEAAPAADTEAEPVTEAQAEEAQATPTKSLFEKVQETAVAATAEAEPAPVDEQPTAPKRPSLFGGATPPQNS
jgi:hypothetical protein